MKLQTFMPTPMLPQVNHFNLYTSYFSFIKMIPFTQQPQQQLQQQQFIPKKVIENYSYQLNDQIGKGYSSRVFKGKEDRTEEEVAVKVIDMKLMNNEVQQFLLQNEISILKKLSATNNINLLKLCNYFQTANNTYLITEICNQGDLKDLLKKYTNLDEPQALKILKHLVNGYRELAKQRIVHRDIKPANILLNDGIPKLADFGFAKEIDAPPYKYYYNVGTPMYMCPQSLQKNEYSQKSDIWSIGVLYYELLYGVTPWTAETEKELQHKVCHISVSFPSSKQISSESKDFIRGCLQVDEKRRFSFEQVEQHPLLKLNFKKDVKQQQLQQLQQPHQQVLQQYQPQQQQQPLQNKVKQPKSLPLQNQVSQQQQQLGNIIQNGQIHLETGKENSPPPSKEIFGNKIVNKTENGLPQTEISSEIIPFKKFSQPAKPLSKEDPKILIEYSHNYQALPRQINPIPSLAPSKALEQVGEDASKSPVTHPHQKQQISLLHQQQSSGNDNSTPMNQLNNQQSSFSQPNNGYSSSNSNPGSTNTNPKDIIMGTVIQDYQIQISSQIASSAITSANSHPSISSQSPSKQQQQQQQQQISESSKNEKIIFSQINMCRFLFRLCKLCEESVKAIETPQLKEKLIFLLSKDIMIKISKLKNMTDNSHNVYHLDNWSIYSTSLPFTRFQLVINEYYTKYNRYFSMVQDKCKLIQDELQRDSKFDAVYDDNFLELESYYLILQSYLRCGIREINHLSKVRLQSFTEQLPIEIENNVVLLDYLVTYFQLTHLILEKFNGYDIFAEQSHIDKIVEGKPVNLNKTHYAQIRYKIYQLEI